ncbi:uncharacterized protein K489DRAFT_35280 [Dissoconium aciculare CBS 342.82]|uniref:Uncharacterized protein n=1 Tax=Dissoconium aciculare CBS 342.82 TaxID=1314786 RepID=A0A6J3LZ17_9PEZI|nr:uncharacterized protein K489DRAFT_35280 [Dissoconium aciculare CBS 342.82]KAF1820529.1 hypothetical protein K489DRAFT_35280 [Dissoconium aciculare CBS 342.82]
MAFLFRQISTIIKFPCTRWELLWDLGALSKEGRFSVLFFPLTSRLTRTRAPNDEWIRFYCFERSFQGEKYLHFQYRRADRKASSNSGPSSPARPLTTLWTMLLEDTAQSIDCGRCHANGPAWNEVQQESEKSVYPHTPRQTRSEDKRDRDRVKNRSEQR